MQVIIGGSPSTGSSLLRQLLNRHSAIYCGPETKLFAYPQLFEDWNKYKHRLINRPFLTAPDVHLVRGSNLSGPEQKLESEAVASLIKECQSIQEFASKYFKVPCDQYGKAYWAEKTPANVLCFRQFVSSFGDPLVVHMARDPLDTIASLRSRGLSVFQATSRYLFSTSYGLAARENSNYIEIRYEELVRDPEMALADFFKATDLSFESQMLSAGNAEMTEVSKMEGWTHSETDPPDTKAVGRFHQLSELQQNEILQSINGIEISSQFAGLNDLDVRDISGVAEILGYEVPTEVKVSRRFHLRLSSERLSKMMMSFAERRTFWAKERPIEIRKE